jgi:endonuclease/exonuclease/phosphatase family metal-dependent hydrolase
MNQLRDARQITQVPALYSGPTYHGFLSDPGARKHKDRIDYILVSDEVNVERFDAVDNFTGENTASSDHFPLVAEITFR